MKIEETYDKAKEILMTWDKETLIRDCLADMTDEELIKFVGNNEE